MIYKRGFARVHGQRKPIIDNVVIERALGKYGIICMEDLVHEIYTVGKNFKKANKFLWAFKLNSPRKGFNRKSVHFVLGGDNGNREELINELLQRMI